MKKKKGLKLVIALAVVAAIIVAVVLTAGKKELKVSTFTVAEQTVEKTVMATGYIQPVEDVEVGTQVSGVIEKLYVDYNSPVKRGQLLAELDKSTLEEKLTQAKASISSAQSDLNYSRQNHARTQQLFDAKAATQVDLELAQNQLAQAETAYANATANLNQAQVNLDYAYIYSPIDGVVLDRSVNVGQTVAASFNTPTLFTIAEDLTKMQVEADVDEADIGQVELGQKVTFTVDAFSDDLFEGTVSQIRLQPTVTNNVVTYTVIVEAPNPEEKLYPGMTASITIVTRSERGPVVPVEATNFNMTEDIMSRLEVVPGDAAAQNARRQVWTIQGDRAEMHGIETGISDGINTIVKSGVSLGEQVILSASLEKKSTGNAAAANPLMPRPPGRR